MTAPAPAENGWQSIETAPRDGTEMIGLWADARCPVVKSVSFDECEWQDGEGNHVLRPTHWMPHPAAPAPAGEDGPVKDTERIYKCADCGVLRTKDEGGTVFTVCDACWDKAYPKSAAPAGEAGAVPPPTEPSGAVEAINALNKIADARVAIDNYIRYGPPSDQRRWNELICDFAAAVRADASREYQQRIAELEQQREELSRAVDGIITIDLQPFAKEWRERATKAESLVEEQAAQIQTLRAALEWIAAQEDLTFAECSLAEAIIGRARAALQEPPK